MSQPYHAGRHFLQIPGPTNVPDRVLRAIDNATMDHRGPAFGRLGRVLLDEFRAVFKTAGAVIVYPASGTGAWEAALVNTLSPGDRVLMCRTGWFATLWREMAERLTLDPVFIDTDWRRGADVAAIGEALAKGYRSIGSRRSASSTTRPRPAARAASTRCARPWTRPSIRRCCWWTRSPRWHRSTIATMPGASMSPSAARRRG